MGRIAASSAILLLFTAELAGGTTLRGEQQRAGFLLGCAWNRVSGVDPHLVQPAMRMLRFKAWTFLRASPGWALTRMSSTWEESGPVSVS